MQTKMQNVIKGLRWIPTIHSTYNTNIALRPPAEVAASQCRAQTQVMWRLCCCQSQLCCKFEQLPKHVNLLMFKRGRKGKYFFCIPYPENFITVSSLSYIWVYNIERGTQLCRQAALPLKVIIIALCCIVSWVDILISTTCTCDIFIS